MILTCPECATRYFVDDAKLGAEGRTVRCASCGHRWRAKAEAELELVSSAEEGAVAANPAEPQAKEKPAEPLPKAFRARAVEKKTMRQAMVHGVVWAVMAAVLLVILIAAALFRGDIVRLIPRAAGAYAMVGLTVNPTGLVFEGVAAHPALQDGHSALVVSGTIRNVENRAVVAPAIRIEVLDKSGKAVASQIAATDNAHIKPGEARHFVVSVIDPPASANNVEVAFAFDDAKGKTKLNAASHDVPAARPAQPVHALRGATAPEPVDVAPVIEAAQPLAADSPFAVPHAAEEHHDDGHS